MIRSERQHERVVDAEPDSSEVTAWAKNLTRKIKNGLPRLPEFQLASVRFGTEGFFREGGLRKIKFTRGNHNYEIDYENIDGDEFIEFRRKFPRDGSYGTGPDVATFNERLILTTGPGVVKDGKAHILNQSYDSNGKGHMEWIGGFGTDSTRADITGARELLSVVFDRPTHIETLTKAS